MYRRRFADRQTRVDLWRVFSDDFFRGYIPADAVFLEIGAGYCEIINGARARRRIASTSHGNRSSRPSRRFAGCRAPPDAC